MVTKIWQVDFQSRVSVSESRAGEARQVLSLSPKNQFFKTKQLSNLHSGVESITSRTPGRAKPLSVDWEPQGHFFHDSLPEMGAMGLCLALASVSAESKLCAVAAHPFFLVQDCGQLSSQGK